MNFRLFLSMLTALVAALVGAQSVSIHTSDDKGLSWAIVRVSAGGKADIGDLGGVHIGQVSHDDLFVVRDGKAFEISDEAVLREVEAANGPVDKIRDQRFKLKSQWRDLRLQERSEEREIRGFDRTKQRLERNLDRADDDGKSNLQRQLSDIDRQMADIDRQITAMTARVDSASRQVDAASKTLDGARADRNRKVETIVNEAFAKGLAKPFRD